MDKIWAKAAEGLLSAGSLEKMAGESVTLHGMVQRIRRLGWGAFIVMRRHDGLLQCVIGNEGNEKLLEKLSEEQCAELSGTLQEADIKDASINPSTVELQVDSGRIIHDPEVRPSVDLAKKVLDLHIDTNLDLRPLSLRHPMERARLKVSEALTRAFRGYLYDQGFTEIHTPKICVAGAEGGANIFTVEYFDRKAFLAQSPQFYKQMGVAIYERVTEIGPVFRAEPHQTSRHVNEYTSLDLEMGFISGQEDVMAMEMGYIRKALQLLRRDYSYQLQLLDVNLPEPPDWIPSITLRDAHEIAGEMLEEDFSDEPDLEPVEEKAVCRYFLESEGCEFVFVTHFPREKRPFYAMDDPQTPGDTLSFDLLFRGLEITTGGQRIHDYDMQVEKLRRFGLDPNEFESYLMAHKFGLPPHGGLAIGLERFTARLLDVENIRLTTMFPRDVKRLTP
ncbi:aspartate--tRNA(Asn) ligase [Candidatus Fermentibacteria bacterium]|nr:aspartate--tRNA(Asn) ligase [Candidatus Fermentibacteria bacterium]